MPSESGDLKLLGNFRKLIDLVSADANYKPSNAALKKTALNALHTSATDAAQDVPDQRSANMVVISDREKGFAGVNSLMTRVHGLAKASGAPPHTVADLNIFRRKLSPTPRKNKEKEPPANNAATEPAAKQRSTAQGSYDNQLGHLRGYLGVLSTVSSYDPSEADLKLPALQSFVDDLQAKNDAVSASFVPLSQARGLRDQLLYQADNSVVNTAMLVKEYVKGAFGTQSQLYKQIKPLRFKRVKK
jgi:hypothetical protein